MKHASILLFAIITSGCSPAASNRPVSAPDPRIEANLSEIVAIEERRVEEQKFLCEMGQGNVDDLLAAQERLSEARIELAMEKGQREEVEKELQALLTNQRESLERGEGLLEEERESKANVNAARAAVLKAEVRLLRHQQGR